MESINPILELVTPEIALVLGGIFFLSVVTILLLSAFQWLRVLTLIIRNKLRNRHKRDNSGSPLWGIVGVLIFLTIHARWSYYHTKIFGPPTHVTHGSLNHINYGWDTWLATLTQSPIITFAVLGLFAHFVYVMWLEMKEFFKR